MGLDMHELHMVSRLPLGTHNESAQTDRQTDTRAGGQAGRQARKFCYENIIVTINKPGAT